MVNIYFSRKLYLWVGSQKKMKGGRVGEKSPPPMFLETSRSETENHNSPTLRRVLLYYSKLPPLPFATFVPKSKKAVANVIDFFH